jgi:hypothetical protein
MPLHVMITFHLSVVTMIREITAAESEGENPVRNATVAKRTLDLITTQFLHLN